jgi:SAM-dependent methyltransferase
MRTFADNRTATKRGGFDFMIRTPYDLIAQEWTGLRTRLFPKEVEYLEVILEGMPPGGTVLDLGCGTGHPIATHLAAHGFKVVGVDASAEMLALARARFPEHRWIHEWIENVEFSELFDAAICWDALFHLPRVQFAPVIRNLSRWLKPGARLMVSSGGVVDEGEGFTDTMFGQEFYYDSLPPGEMVSLIENSGFGVLKAEMCNLPDGGRDRGKWATVAFRLG